MKFDTFQKELLELVRDSHSNAPNYVEGVNKLIPYGKAYIQFWTKLGVPSESYSEITDCKELEALYDYILKAYRNDDIDYNIVDHDYYRRGEYCLNLDILISNETLVVERTQAELTKTTRDLQRFLWELGYGQGLKRTDNPDGTNFACDGEKWLNQAFVVSENGLGYFTFDNVSILLTHTP